MEVDLRIQTYTEPVSLKYGKLATKYRCIYGYFYSAVRFGTRRTPLMAFIELVASIDLEMSRLIAFDAVIVPSTAAAAAAATADSEAVPPEPILEVQVEQSIDPASVCVRAADSNF